VKFCFTLHSLPLRFFIFLILVLGGSAQLCAAQGFYYLAPPKVRAALPAGQHVVTHVVDARSQRASLGLVTRQGGLQLAAFRDGLPATLQAFFAKYAYANPGAQPLVMRLTNLEIAETNTTLAEIATAGLVANFYAQQPDSSYRLVAHFAQTQARSALDVTGQHPSTIGELLLAAVALARERAAGATAGPAYSLPQLLDPQPLPGETLPVLDQAVRPRPGYYHTISEFWHNQPSEPGQPTGEVKTAQNAEWAGDKYYKPYRTTAQGRYEPVTDVWGFCDGQNYYVRLGAEFYQLKRNGTNFDFFGSSGNNPALHTAVNMLGVATAATMGMGLFSTNGEHRVLYHLNLLTGTFSLNQTNSAVTTTVAGRPTHLFIYRPRAEKGPPVRIRLADDQPAQELAAGDFLTFEPASDAPLRVCLLPAAGEPAYLAITPTAEAPTYLECRPTTPEPLRKVQDAAGAAALSKLVK
jgi:hypothetical protein